MNDGLIWLIASGGILLILIAFLIIFLIRNKGKKPEPDYYLFFILGIIWTGVGVSLSTTTGNYGILIIGITFLVLGLVNKDKWKTNKKSWDKLNTRKKKIKLWILVLLGIVGFLFVRGF